MGQLNTSYKSIIWLASPIILGAFVQTLILFVDSIFLSSYSTDAFIAAGYGNLPYITFFMLGNGLGDGGQIVMAKYFGASDEIRLKQSFQSNLINLFVLSIFLCVLTQVFRVHALPDLIQGASIELETNRYLNIRAYGFVASLLTLGVTSFYLAIGRSGILLINTLLLCTVNIVLDYGLIFGNWGMAAMGTEGAALATLIAEFTVCVFSLSYLLLDRAQITQGIFKAFFYVKDRAKEIIKLSYPLMAQGFVAVVAWSSFFFMIEKMGAREAEVSRILHNLYWIALIPMFGFTAATRTYTSNLLAENNVEMVKSTVKKVLLVNYIFLLIFVHGFILYPDYLIELVDQKASYRVVEETSFILRYLFLSVLIHAAAGIFQSLIAGSGKTREAFIMEMIAISIYLVFAALVIFEAQWSIEYVWLSEFVYFMVFFILTYTYYKGGKWYKTSRTNG